MYIKYLAPVLYICSRTSYISSVKLIGRYERNAFHNNRYSTNALPSSMLSSSKIFNQFYKNRDNTSTIYEQKIDVYTLNDKIIQNNKIIYVSPGGLRGFYQMGVCNYIKNNFEIEDYVFTGSCSGAWNCLLLSMKPYVNVDKFIKSAINLDLKDMNNINDIQTNLKYEILENYCTSDFYLNKLFIGVTSKDRSSFKTNVYSEFKDLEEVIDVCIASSFSNTFNLNRNMTYYDKFNTKENPTFMSVSTSVLHISPYMWTSTYKKRCTIDLLLPNKFNINKLYHDGYRDSDLNHNHLRYILNSNE